MNPFPRPRSFIVNHSRIDVKKSVRVDEMRHQPARGSADSRWVGGAGLSGSPFAECSGRRDGGEQDARRRTEPYFEWSSSLRRFDPPFSISTSSSVLELYFAGIMSLIGAPLRACPFARLPRFSGSAALIATL